ncbi:MAG: hypothetical protein V4487_03065 [Chlamydiota bacterium]
MEAISQTLCSSAWEKIGFEELLPARKEFLRSDKGDGQVPCREWTDSSLDPGLLDGDCAELPVQKTFEELVQIYIR